MNTAPNATPLTSDDLSRKRRRLLFWNMITWAVWVLMLIAGIATHNYRSLANPYGAVALTLQMLAWLGWVVAMIALMRFQKVLKEHRALGMALFDEFFVQIRLKAAWYSFWAMLICQSAIVVVAAFYSFPANVGGMVSMFVGVVTFFAAFLILDRE